MFSSWLHNVGRSFLLYAIASVGLFSGAAGYAVLQLHGVGSPWIFLPLFFGLILGLVLWDLGQQRLVARDSGKQIRAVDADQTAKFSVSRN
ncbi:MAG TPA: hypothetical protein VKR29_13375 [Candidatus Binataceae bacterium]|nr:hypothetical protein [Candidatus Binataceae bacterium]